MDPHETLIHILEQGLQTRTDALSFPPPLPTTVAPDTVASRYEQLAEAAKAYVFTVIIKKGKAACTIHYPGVFQVTGYTEEDYAAQPMLWSEMIYAEDKDIVLAQIAQLLQGETPPPIKHRIRRKDGAIRWLRNTSVPVYDAQGTLVAYDGLVIDISEREAVEASHERQIAELTTALIMVKALQSLLPICCSCKKIRDDKGYWQQLESYIEGHFSSIGFTHGICPECTNRLYPWYHEEAEPPAT